MIKKFHVLVVEDEKDVRELILLHLKREGIAVTGVENGESALTLLEQNKYDLAVLDWMLPGFSGLELCKLLRGKLPVLMVTARADTTDIVLALEMGADDYVTKPFEVPVFLARVRALLRRANIPQGKGGDQRQLQLGGLSLDLDTFKVTCNSAEIFLTVSEFKLLTVLIQNQGKVLSRKNLIELVRGQGVSIVERAIDTHVFGLRKKLGDCADLVETVRGIGYRVQSQSDL